MKKIKYISVFFTICFCFITFVGCSNRFDLPYDYKNINWVSNEAGITASASGMNLVGSIEKDGVTTYFVSSWGISGEFKFYKVDDLANPVWTEDGLLFSGTFKGKYSNNEIKDYFVLTITTDNFYNNKFKTITLKQQSL